MSTELTVRQKNEMEVIVSNANNLKINNDDDQQRALEVLPSIQEKLKLINETFDPIVKKAHEAHKEALKQKKTHADPLENAKRIIGRKVGAYQQEQERKAEEKRRLEQAELQKRAEEEALQAAEELESVGDTEAAEMVLETPVVAQAAPVKEAPKVSGIAVKKTWKFRVKNPNLIPREYLTIDEKKIGGIVRAMKDQTNIPGVEVYFESKASATGR